MRFLQISWANEENSDEKPHTACIVVPNAAPETLEIGHTESIVVPNAALETPGIGHTESSVVPNAAPKTPGISEESDVLNDASSSVAVSMN